MFEVVCGVENTSGCIEIQLWRDGGESSSGFESAITLKMWENRSKSPRRLTHEDVFNVEKNGALNTETFS